MRKKSMWGWIGFALALTLLAITVMLCGCSSTKDIAKDETKVDNTREKELSDSLRMITQEKDRLESEVKELQYAGVIFRTDTVNHRDTITNTIEITKEGAIKATGNIGSAYVSKSFVARIISEKDRLIDSFRNVKLQEKYITKTITITKDKHTKTTFMPWWIWLVIGFVLGKWGGRIFNFIKQKIPNMKMLLLFAICTMFLMSCGGAGKSPDELITWGQAWNHVSHSFSYWLFVIISLGFLGWEVIKQVKSYGKGYATGMEVTLWILLALTIFITCLVVRPCEVAANTTVEQAARGAWIGY